MQKHSHILKKNLVLKIDQIFNKQPAQKILFIHQDLLQLLNFSYDFKLNNLIQNNQIVLFQNDTKAQDNFQKENTLIFILNPVTSVVLTLQSIIISNQNKAKNKRYVIYFVPKVDNFCIDKLPKSNLKSTIQVKDFNFGLISVNQGLISLELTPYNHPVEVTNLSVEALMKMSKLAGRFGQIIGKGQKSKSILELYEKLIQEDDSIETNQNSLLVVMDRKIDPITPLLTGHSYQALLDHFYGINHNKIMVPTSLLGGAGNNLQQYLLHNERDPVYQQIAYLSIEQARDQIQKKSIQIKAKLQSKRYNVKTQQDTQQVNKIRSQFQQIQNHTQIILQILNRMNQLHFYNLINIQTGLINQGKAQLQDLHYLTLEYGVEEILRVISLYSQIYINANFYTRYQKEILQIIGNNYSPIHIYSLYQLQKAGFLKNSKMKNKWEQLKIQFDVLPDEPHSYTEVHITYSALSVRFIELILKKKLTPELSAMLGKQNFMRGLQKEKNIKDVYVFYVGGVTYGEISCLKLLEKELNVKIHILTTNVASGSKMIKKIIENRDL